MKRLVIGAAAAVGAVAVAAVLMVTMWLPGTASASTGPGISVTNVTLLANGVGGCTNAGGCVAFDVVSTGSGFAAYNGDNLEISWDPAVFQFGSAAGTGQFAGALCSVNVGAPPPPPPAPFPQTAGSYLNMGCVALGPTFTTAGTMANVILNIAGTGCSPVHLVTFGAPDGGDSSNGTFTTDAADASVQTNTYADFSTVGTGGIDQTGATGCTLVGPTPTDTAVPPTATNTPVPGAPTDTPVPAATDTPAPAATDTPVSGATNTPVSGNTATPVLRTVTPSPTVGTPSANTPVPAATSTTAPGGGPGGVATAPGGGPGGVITGPNTGTGAESGGGFNVVMAALLAAVAMLVVGSGAGYAWWRRAQGR